MRKKIAISMLNNTLCYFKQQLETSSLLVTLLHVAFEYVLMKCCKCCCYFSTVKPRFTDTRPVDMDTRPVDTDTRPVDTDTGLTINYGQFALSLGKESPYIVSKFNPLITDNPLIQTLSMGPSVWGLTVKGKL